MQEYPTDTGAKCAGLIWTDVPVSHNYWTSKTSRTANIHVTKVKKVHVCIISSGFKPLKHKDTGHEDSKELTGRTRSTADVVAFSHNLNCHRSATADDIFTLWSQNKQTTKIRPCSFRCDVITTPVQRFEMPIHLYRVFLFMMNVSVDEKSGLHRAGSALGLFFHDAVLLQ